MKPALRSFGFIAVAALLAGCGGALTPSDGLNRALQMPLGSRSSPVDGSLRAKPLLYASNIYNCDVYVLDYPRGKVVQTIDSCAFGFGPAFGLCTDSAGDVFMAMGEGFSIFEFARGGSEPISQLENDSLLPVGCSVDPGTGDLGVASAEGNLAVYKNASGTPQIYALSGISEFFFCAYDDRGNLFATGMHGDHSFAFAELPKDGSALREISLSTPLGPGYAVQWDGRHLAIGGTGGSNTFTLYRIRVAGTSAKVIGKTTLDAVPDRSVPVQFWIRNDRIVQPENANAELGFWKYPDGGKPVKTIEFDGANLVGVTVSAPARR